ncbi:CRTAC1 family protein [Verrucomicrobia bacterium]|jgi:enediyne biosynthesis protein E4|nr:CRTAC1 family protein [Verrucomicrobiota bacterium]MDA7866544.1 CRTAC1 family protein [Verrucomicrobiota bacterium]
MSCFTSSHRSLRTKGDSTHLFTTFIPHLPLLGVFLVTATLQIAAQSSPEHAFALSQLQLRAQLQQEKAKEKDTFSGFQFEDQITKSGIRFRHHIVDDAGLSYKAAHYDHGNGVAVADVDGDGLLDLYFTTQLGVNQLWRNRGNARFENVTSKAGLGLPNQVVVSAAFGDVDNDGDPDLYVTTVKRGNHFFENQGNGRFMDRTKESGLTYVGHSSGSTFLDYDNDGLLDLFLVNVGQYTSKERGRGGYYRALPDAFSGHLFPERTEKSILYHNQGNNEFKDVSAEMGLEDESWSGDCTFTDLNRDGYPDLYLVNMQGDDHYYENQAGKKFIEKTSQYFPKTPWGAMGVKFFDYDRNGHMDLYLTDMHSDMTQGQTVEALKFGLKKEKTKSEAYCSIQWTEAYLQGASNNIFGNAFYRNSGSGVLEEVSDQLNVETYWPWGFSVGDLNADGFDDLFVAAGMGYPFRYGINSLLLNDQGQTFFDAEFLVGVEPRGDGRTERVWFTLDCDGADKDHPECEGQTGRKKVLGTLSTRSSVIVDIDGDGDLDIITNEFNDRPQFLLSNLSEKKPIHFLKLKLEGNASNRDALGAMVQVTSKGQTSTQYIDGKSGYLAQSSIPLYFGLGTATSVDSITVRWPSGKTQQLSKDIPIDTQWTIREID